MSGAGSSDASTNKWAVGSHKGSARRIQRELKLLTENPPTNCSAGPKGDNLYEWVATVVGPVGTPYESGVFFIAIEFPDNYPFTAPKLTFRTRVYHCNINSKGLVCFDMLNNNWNPALGVEYLLNAILELLKEPNPYDPLVGSIAVEYLTNRPQHDATARDWTHRFAS